jgi:hypothetical protein
VSKLYYAKSGDFVILMVLCKDFETFLDEDVLCEDSACLIRFAQGG